MPKYVHFVWSGKPDCEKNEQSALYGPLDIILNGQLDQNPDEDDQNKTKFIFWHDQGGSEEIKNYIMKYAKDKFLSSDDPNRDIKLEYLNLKLQVKDIKQEIIDIKDSESPISELLRSEQFSDFERNVLQKYDTLGYHNILKEVYSLILMSTYKSSYFLDTTIYYDKALDRSARSLPDYSQEKAPLICSRRTGEGKQADVWAYYSGDGEQQSERFKNALIFCIEGHKTFSDFQNALASYENPALRELLLKSCDNYKNLLDAKAGVYLTEERYTILRSAYLATTDEFVTKITSDGCFIQNLPDDVNKKALNYKQSLAFNLTYSYFCYINSAPGVINYNQFPINPSIAGALFIGPIGSSFGFFGDPGSKYRNTEGVQDRTRWFLSATNPNYGWTEHYDEAGRQLPFIKTFGMTNWQSKFYKSQRAQVGNTSIYNFESPPFNSNLDQNELIWHEIKKRHDRSTVPTVPPLTNVLRRRPPGRRQPDLTLTGSIPPGPISPGPIPPVTIPPGSRQQVIEQQASILPGKLDTEENRNRLIANGRYIEEIKSGLLALRTANIVDQDNFNALITKAVYADNIGCALPLLHKAGILTKGNRITLVNNAQHVKWLNDILSRLGHAGLLKQDNFDALVTNAHYSQGLAEGVLSLQKNSNLNQHSFNALIKNAQYAPYLQNANIFNQNNLNALLANTHYSEGLGKGLSSLHSANILNQNNFNALIDTALHQQFLGKVLSLLHSSDLLTQDSFNALIANVQYAYQLSEGLSLLQRAGILNQVYYDTLINNAQYAPGLGLGFVTLKDVGIFDQDNYIALVDNARYADELADGLSSLQHAGILNQENFNTLAANAQCADELADGLSSLQHAGILKQENFHALVANVQSTRDINYALNYLQKLPENLIQANFEALIVNALHAQGLGLGLCLLDNANILSQNNFEALIVNAEHAQGLGSGLLLLTDAGILNQENFNTLAANAQYAQGLGEGLLSLRNAHILNQENFFNTLAANAQHAQGLVSGLLSLKDAGILEQANFDALVANAEDAEDLGCVLSFLNEAGRLNQESFDQLVNNIAGEIDDIGHNVITPGGRTLIHYASSMGRRSLVDRILPEPGQQNQLPRAPR